MELTGTGIWSGQLRFGDAGERAEAAAELEELGYTALWIPGGVGGAVFDDCRVLLEATSRVPVATGILNLWMHTPEETATGHAALTADFPDRFMLGLGVSHAPLIDQNAPGRYARPLQVTREYLDALDGTTPPVPAGERCLAALGPRMLELARDRSAGAHPYLVHPDHTRFAREVMGDGVLLAPEQHVVLETDPEVARATARQHLGIYRGLPNYTNNWKRFGLTDDDLADEGSDRLVDMVVAWGDEDAIARRVREHFDAGADHVCIQVLSDTRSPLNPASAFPWDGWRRLAPALPR